MFYLDYHAFAQRYGTASTLPYLEALLRSRSDLDKADIKDIVSFIHNRVNKKALPHDLYSSNKMEGIKRKPAEPEPEYPSIFTRLRA